MPTTTAISAWNRFLTDYGMLGVLLLLCLFYSWKTYGSRDREGADAVENTAAQVAQSVDAGSGVLILAGKGKVEEEFADALQAQLVEDGFHVTERVTGGPPDVARAMKRLDKADTSVEAIAAAKCHAKVIGKRQEALPALADVPVFYPEPYWGSVFLSTDNLLNVANQIVVIAVIAVGMTMVIITGGIDLSVGSLVALSAVSVAWLIRSSAGGIGGDGSAEGFDFQPVFHGGWLIGSLVLLALGVGGIIRARAAKTPHLHDLGRLAVLLSAGGLAWVAFPYLIDACVRMVQWLGPSPLGMAVCCLLAIAACAGVGAFSGLMVAMFKIPPFIATLAMMLIASGLAFIVTGGHSIADEIPDSFTWLGRGRDLLSIPNAVVLMGIIYLLAHVVMSRTTMGRYIYAVGGNREAARLSGIRAGRILLIVYILCGAMAGLGGVIEASNLKSGAPTYGLMYELRVIAAVVVGGTSLAGGEGKIFGTLIGALIIGVIQNGMNLTNVQEYHQKVVLGAVILIAVLLDTLRKKGLKGILSLE